MAPYVLFSIYEQMCYHQFKHYNRSLRWINIYLEKQKAYHSVSVYKQWQNSVSLYFFFSMVSPPISILN